MSLQTGASSNRVKGAVNRCNDKQRELNRISCNDAVAMVFWCFYKAKKKQRSKNVEIGLFGVFAYF